MAELDINKLNASVASITPASADANVRLEATENGPEFVFSFKLPAGQDGKDGTNVIGVVLTDENVWVPCLDDGTPDPDLKEHASTKIILQDGDKVIDKGVSYSITHPDTPGEFKVDQFGDVTVKLTKESAELIEITCTAIYNRVEHNKTFRVKKAIGTPVYKVVPDVSAIKQDNSIKVPEELRVDVLKWNGKNWGKTSDLPVMYNYTLVEGNETHKGLEATATWEDEDTVNYTINVENLNNLKNLEVYIEKDGVVLDYQSISIVKDGIGIINATAYAVVDSTQDLSNYTVTGGSYWTINDPDTYDSLITLDSEDSNIPISWSRTNSNQRNDAQAVWMISQVFASTDDPDTPQTWSYPIRLQDSDIFQVEYSAKETETPPSDIIQLETIIDSLVLAGTSRQDLTSEVLEAKWRELEANKVDPWEWSDTVENPKWMATCRLQNGKWTKWTVTKCRGEVGYNAQQIELSNESEYVPCINVADESDTTKSTWVPDPDLYGESGVIASTEIVLMDGHENITGDCKIGIVCTDSTISDWDGEHDFDTNTATDSSGNTQWEFTTKDGSNGGKIGVLNVHQIYDDVTHYTVTLTYTSKRHGNEVQYKGTFKIIKVKNATTYKISTNVNAVKIDAAKNAYPDKLEVSLLKWDGQKWTDVELSETNTYGLDATCEGKSNSNQTSEVVEIPHEAKSYDKGKFIIDIEDDTLWTDGYPGQFIFSVPITSEDGDKIGTEKESIPVMSDGINITGVYEYYTKTSSADKPDGTGFTVGGNIENLGQDIDGWMYNSMPNIDIDNPYLWNQEVVVNSWGDIVTVTGVELIGKYGADGMTPYEVLEFYDVDDNNESEENDGLTEYVYASSYKEIPIPTPKEPYLYGFEIVLYGREGNKFHDSTVFYDKSTKKFVGTDNLELCEEDNVAANNGLIKWEMTPISLVSKIGAGSFTEQVYKYIAQGEDTTVESPSNAVLKVPGNIGSYAKPRPDDYSEEEQSASDKWNNWTDGIPTKTYDFKGNELSDYNSRKHGGRVLYMSLRTFTTDGEAPQDSEWKAATIASDVEGKVDYEWATGYEDESTIDPPGAESWGESSPWTNDPTENAVWMAVRHMKAGGIWEGWSVSKIKGDKGKTGDDGVAITISLDEDQTTFVTDSEGNLLNNSNVQNYANVYCNGSNVNDLCDFLWTIDGETRRWVGNCITLTSGEINTILTSTQRVKLSVIYKPTLVTYTKTWHLIASKGNPAYNVVLSSNTYNESTSSPSTFKATVTKADGGKSLGYVTSGVSIYFSKDGTVTNKSSNTWTYSNSNWTHDSSFDKNYPYVLLCDSDNNILDCEHIDIIQNGFNGKDGEDGTSITVEYKYCITETTSKPSKDSSNWTDTFTNPSSSYKYSWCKETTYIIDSSGNKTELNCVIYIKSVFGESGKTGDPAPIAYSAGIWSPTISYQRIETTYDSDGTVDIHGKVPFVYYPNDPKETYYYMLKATVAGNANNATPNNDTSHWEPMQYYSAIFADVGAFGQALVGKFVFYENYFFSQNGKYISDNDSSYLITGKDGTSYEDYSNLVDAIKNGCFVPNVLINAVTGESHFAANNIHFDDDGSGWLGTADKKIITWDVNGSSLQSGMNINKELTDVISDIASINGKNYFTRDSLQYTPEFNINEKIWLNLNLTYILNTDGADVDTSNGVALTIKSPTLTNTGSASDGYVGSLTMFNTFNGGPAATITINLYPPNSFGNTLVTTKKIKLAYGYSFTIDYYKKGTYIIGLIPSLGLQITS